MNNHTSPAVKPPPTRRRWWLAGVALVALLAGYAGALAWVTNRLEIDVQKSIHPAPAVMMADHPDSP